MNLIGQRFGRLEVLSRSEKRAPRGARTVPLWKCKCDCGNITYKATDTLTNPDTSMCQKCAQRNSAQKARDKAGFVSGTQLAKIKVDDSKSDNLSGVRGVYFDPKTGRYRARIRFQRKIYSLGTFYNLEDAVKARRLGEEKYFGGFLDSMESNP